MTNQDKPVINKTYRPIYDRLVDLKEEYHPLYLRAVIDSMARRQRKLPTETNDNALLSHLNTQLGGYLSASTLQATKSILDKHRHDRLMDTAKYLIQTGKVKKNIWDILLPRSNDRT